MSQVKNQNNSGRSSKQKYQCFGDEIVATVWHQSLSFKFILIIVLLLSTLMSFFAYLNYHNEIKKLNTELRAKGESLARLTSLAVVEGVLAFDMAELQKPVVYLNKQNDIAYAVIYSAKNENLTNYIDTSNPVIKEAALTLGSDKLKDVIEFLSQSKSIEHIKFPIKYNEFNLGHVAIGMSRNSVIVKSSELLYQKLYETLLLIIILGATIYFVFKVSTIEPIRRLIEGLRQVSMGELDYHVNIENKSELGSLARSFNNMVDELLQTRAEKDSALIQLENLNNDLALDVEASSDALTKISEELEHVAMHDSLTQLPNREGFFKEVRAALEVSKRKGNNIGLIMMNLDRFKEINESKGHEVGDAILIAIAKRLEESIRGKDCVARFGGDEFVVLIDNATVDHLILVTEKLINYIEPEIIIAENKFFITACMGLALYPVDAQTPNDLIRCADIAMHEAKERKDDFMVYHSKLESKKLRHMDLVADLRVALQEDQLFLEYQPKIDISKGIVSGVEALVRWLHPEQGVIPPYEFIGLAENTGLIKPLTSWVLNEAIKQNGLWYNEGLDLTVSVNLSMLNIEDELLAAYVQSLLEKYQLRFTLKM